MAKSPKKRSGSSGKRSSKKTSLPKPEALYSPLQKIATGLLPEFRNPGPVRFGENNRVQIDTLNQVLPRRLKEDPEHPIQKELKTDPGPDKTAALFDNELAAHLAEERMLGTLWVKSQGLTITLSDEVRQDLALEGLRHISSLKQENLTDILKDRYGLQDAFNMFTADLLRERLELSSLIEVFQKTLRFAQADQARKSLTAQEMLETPALFRRILFSGLRPLHFNTHRQLFLAFCQMETPLWQHITLLEDFARRAHQSGRLDDLILIGGMAALLGELAILTAMFARENRDESEIKLETALRLSRNIQDNEARQVLKQVYQEHLGLWPADSPGRKALRQLCETARKLRLDKRANMDENEACTLLNAALEAQVLSLTDPKVTPAMRDHSYETLFDTATSLKLNPLLLGLDLTAPALVESYDTGTAIECVASDQRGSEGLPYRISPVQ